MSNGGEEQADYKDRRRTAQGGSWATDGVALSLPFRLIVYDDRRSDVRCIDVRCSDVGFRLVLRGWPGREESS